MKRTVYLAAIMLIAALAACKGRTMQDITAKSETTQAEKSDTTEQSDEAVIPQIVQSEVCEYVKEVDEA